MQFLVLRPDGSAVSSNSVEQQAAAEGIAVREGCMCNPSQCNKDLGITPEEVRQAWQLQGWATRIVQHMWLPG